MTAADHRNGCFLKPVHVAGLPDRIAVEPGGMSLGRAASNGIVVPSELFPQVSAHHARLTVNGSEVVIEDLGSRNGTFVNGNRVDRRVLRDGDFVQLGAQGPQFVLEAAAVESATVLADGPAPGTRHDPSQTTVVRLRRALGIPEGANVAQVMLSHERRWRKGVGLTVVAVTLVGVAVAVAASRSQDDVRRLEKLNQELKVDFSAATHAFEEQRQVWEAQKKRLESERATLQQNIQNVADQEQTSSTELYRLRQSLEDTNRSLERMNPVNVEQLRVAGVGRVQRSVVFVETKLRYRSNKNQLLLRRKTGDNVDESVTFDDDGEFVERESSGSGFCIAAEGFIITNAHVVRPKGHDEPIEIDKEESLQPELLHDVVFSNDDRRHTARVVRVLEDGDDDLALLKIEPFPDMPHLDGFRTDVVPPLAGAEVYVHGFPLGKMAIQEGNKVIASIFRGILSRPVSTWLQVDAAVHPGNSGGPLTDASGRVIGVVTRVQRIPEGPLAPDMGYAIPIAAVARLWPPPPDSK